MYSIYPSNINKHCKYWRNVARLMKCAMKRAMLFVLELGLGYINSALYHWATWFFLYNMSPSFYFIFLFIKDTHWEKAPSNKIQRFRKV